MRFDKIGTRLYKSKDGNKYRVQYRGKNNKITSKTFGGANAEAKATEFRNNSTSAALKKNPIPGVKPFVNSVKKPVSAEGVEQPVASVLQDAAGEFLIIITRDHHVLDHILSRFAP